MRIFLTGATGFIGSHVARRLVADDHQVTALVRPSADLRRIADLRDRIRLVFGDITEAAGLLERLRNDPPELCLHLAWYAVPGRYLEAPENLSCVSGSLELCRVLEQAGCRRVVMAGTCFEYDAEAGYLSEQSPVRPRSLYAASKHALYLMAERLLADRGVSFAWARIFYQYGPWEDGRRLVPLVVRRLLAGEPCPLSPGTQLRDFLHVEDVAAALCAIARSDLQGPVNIGSSRPVSVAEVATSIGRLLDRPELVRLGEMPMPAGEPPLILANAQLLRDRTGWSPRFDLEEGLRNTVEWWKDAPAR